MNNRHIKPLLIAVLFLVVLASFGPANESVSNHTPIKETPTLVTDMVGRNGGVKKTSQNAVPVDITLSSDSAHTISKHIYGHFAEHLGRGIYDGIWVGKDSDIPNIDGLRLDVVSALKALNIPNLRWPGGCFADTYHWEDGIGPIEERKAQSNIHWGNSLESNEFGTHEFMQLVELIGAEAYISGNLGSGTVEEMAEWVEYLTSDVNTAVVQKRKANGREEPWKVKFWGIGNENWGCGGNMEVDYYADLFRQYNTFLRNYSGNRLNRVAVGPHGNEFDWTEGYFKNGWNVWVTDIYAIHYYTWIDGWYKKGHDTDFEEYHWIKCMWSAQQMEETILKHMEIMDKYDKDKKVKLAVDEWGNWFDNGADDAASSLYQQNTLRDALSASVALNIFNKHGYRITMANIAQMVNVLQSVILTSKDQIVLTPTYHTFYMYKDHMEAEYIPTDFKSPEYRLDDLSVEAISITASKKDDGVYITLSNLNPNQSYPIRLHNIDNSQEIASTILTSEKINDYNTFGQDPVVTPKPFNGIKKIKDGLSFEIPSKSLITIKIN